MRDRYKIVIASDPDHDKVYAEIQCNHKFIALVSQEDGMDQLKVELPGPELDQRHVLRVVPLDDFVRLLEKAAKKLVTGVE